MAARRGKRVAASIDPDDDEDNLLSDVEEVNSDTEYRSQPVSSQQVSSKRVAQSRGGTKAGKSKVTTPTKTSPSKTSKTKVANGSSKGTIASFFSAATQQKQEPRQLSTTTISSQHTTPSKPASQPYHEDLIDEIDDRPGDILVLNGSQTAQAARKRKQNDVDHLSDPAVFNQSSGSLKFRKLLTIPTGSAAAKEVDQRPWVERFAPSDLSELAVHTKKVADVRAQLSQALSSAYGPRLIVLKGPAGVGKTATVKLLAKELDVSIKEWRSPQDVEFGSETSRSIASQFDEFIIMGSRFTTLDVVSANVPSSQAQKPLMNGSNGHDDKRQQLLLIEEFPATLSRSSTTLQSFRATLAAYLAAPYQRASPPAPIVLVISETLLSANGTNDTLNANRLLGSAILTHELVVTLEFNPVAQTFLTKALSLVAIKESRVTGRRRTPGPAVLTKLAETGDIRSAISGLEMLCIMGDNSDAWSAKISFTQPKGMTKGKAAAAEQTMTPRERDALKVISGRDSTLGLWHAVGKVVYNKRVDPPAKDHVRKPSAETSIAGLDALLPASSLSRMPPQLPPHLAHLQRSKVPENDPEQLLVELSSDISTFVASIHENFAPSCANPSSETTLESLENCLAYISDADVLSIDRFGAGFGTGTAIEGLRQDEIAFHTAVRGVVFNLPYPVKRETGGQTARRGGNTMSWPRSLRLWRDIEEIDDLVDVTMEDYRTALHSGKLSASDHDVAAAGDGDVPYAMASAASKVDFILDQAPRMKVIHDARHTMSTMRSRIRQLTTLETLHASFNMIDGKLVRSEEEDEEAEHMHRERRTRTGKRDDGASLGLGLVEKDVKELVLSDDDIIDD